MGEQQDGRFTPSDTALIRHKARRLVGHHGYRSSDVEDLEQDLSLQVLRQSHRYRPRRGSREAFMTTVIKNKVLNMTEYRTARKRNGRDVVSLGPDVATPSVPAATARVGLSIDVSAVVDGLPEDLRQVAVLRPHHTLREVEARLGLNRDQLRGRLRRLADVFRRAGLAPDEIAKPHPLRRATR